MPFNNRLEAGRLLASKLSQYAGRSDVVVLALPRGGVPVGFEVARRLGAPLDVCLDRRDGLFRGGRRPLEVRDRIAILIDDGLATGATMEAAIVALRQRKPARIVVAAPVGAKETCARLQTVADHVICLSTPEPFRAVGRWYLDFAQTSDEEVSHLLAAAGRVVLPSDAGLRLERNAVRLINARAIRLLGDPSQYDALIDAAGDARVVLLGGATHGTHEFYRERAFITRRLIAERGFAGVAVEADWPDACRVNHYVCGRGAAEDAADALRGFRRFPTWMWRNADVLDFVGWLRTYNETKPEKDRAGFYGLDRWSLRASLHAEIAYRTMSRECVEAWNRRDRHMMDTLRELLAFLDRSRPNARLVVWAHNSHLGDARATELGEVGELNVGQLARERFGTGAVLVGFTTHTGTVTAASEWDAPAHRTHVRPALAGSYERLFHEVDIPRFLLPLRTDPELTSVLSAPRLERAIGAIYHPETERRSHYFHARLADQFDYVLHIDETRAVEPLECPATWTAGEVAETYPSGL